MSRIDVSKEYVREQLQAMGVKKLTEKDLEAYTRDFSRLIQDHLQHDSLVSVSEESFFSNNSSRLSSEQESATGKSRQRSMPQFPHQQKQQQHTALFKTFPGDKENRIHSLSVSASPSPLRPPPPATIHLSPHRGYETETETPRATSSVQRKRKVLRKIDGEARVFEESYNSEDSRVVDSMTHELSELTLSSSSSSSSVNDSDTTSTSEYYGARSMQTYRKTAGRPRTTPACIHSKAHSTSVIKPASFNPFPRKRTDPVSRYHEWKRSWDSKKLPGEDSRNGLRWHIREQMAQQDLPYYMTPQRKVKWNSYVVPTDKKRRSLRWEIRYQMAQQS